MYLENNRVKRYPVRIVLSWTSVVLWMAVIFAFSHQTAEASGQLSNRLTLVLLSALGNPSAANVEALEGALRMLAHGFLFFVLGLLVSWSFSEVQIRIWRNMLLTLIVSALYAASDEWHQLFVPGRAGQLTDFLIDLAGVVAAILVYQVVATIRDLRQDLSVRKEEDLWPI